MKMKKISYFCFQFDEPQFRNIKKVILKIGSGINIKQTDLTETLEEIIPEPHYSVFLLSDKGNRAEMLGTIRKIRRKFLILPLIVIGSSRPADEIASYIRAGAGSYLEFARMHILPDVIRQLLLEDPLEDLSTDAMLAHYDFLLNISGNQLSMISRDYTYLAINEAFCKAHALIREEVVGKTPEIIWGEKCFREVIRPNLEKCFSSENHLCVI